MAAANWFRYVYLAHVARPKGVRQLYRMVKRHRFCRIVEVGISDVARTAAMIEMAQRFAGQQQVSYTGIDWFDARPPEFAPLSLKRAHQVLGATGARVRLAPGAPGAALAAAANAHQNTDLILIAHAVSDADLAAAWFYVPRMLHERSVILREQRDEKSQAAFSLMSHAQVAERARPAPGRRAA